MTQATSPPSPDPFDDFEYTDEMDDSVHIIEKADEARRHKNLPPLFLCDGIPISDDDDVLMSPTREFDEKTWVVFVGKTTGVYSLL